MRRFILGWKRLGHEERFQARIVNYADDFVILCGRRPEQAMAAMRSVMQKLKVTVNETKTHVCRCPHESFDFLGFTFGRMYSPHTASAYVRVQPARRKMVPFCRKLNEHVARLPTFIRPEALVCRANQKLRGLANYFNYGTHRPVFQAVHHYACRRIRRWLRRKYQFRGKGYRQYPDSRLVTEPGNSWPSLNHRATSRLYCISMVLRGEFVPKVKKEKENRLSHAKENIDYIDGGVELLDLIAPLWAELSDHHQAVSEHFSEAIAQRTFAARKMELVERGSQGHLRVDLARTAAGEAIGYCVSSVDCKQTGEIDSIFVQSPFRNQGIGAALMGRAMRWMEGVGTHSRIVEVAWGNQQAWSFYQRYGFLPRSVRFVQRPSSP